MSEYLYRYRRRIAIGYAIVLSALALNIAVHDGRIPIFVIAGATVGLTVVWVGTALLSGQRVAKHAVAHRAELPAAEAEVRALEAEREARQKALAAARAAYTRTIEAENVKGARR